MPYDGIESFKRLTLVVYPPYKPCGLLLEGMVPRKTKRKATSLSEQWLSRYHDPRAEGSLGGVQRFARAHKIPLKKAQRVLERDIAYTLHKPRRRHFTHSPRDCGWIGRSMGGGSGGSPTLGQVQSRHSLFADGVGRVVQVRVGATLERQNWGGLGQSL